MTSAAIDDLTSLSLLDTAALLRDRAVSSQDLTRAYLSRIDALDGELRNYLTVTREQALAEAAQADAEIAASGWRGPLHGMPIAVKDLFDTAGVLTTANSHVLADNVPATDATVVRRMRAAGAVLLGKLQMNEFAMGALYEDDFRPPARNPWDRLRMTGGSSAGSGGALAAGLCAGSYGSDTGGSIRGPAAYCGIVGLKPTQGLVSRHGVAILSWSLDHVGPMARTVADTAALLQVTAGADPADPASAQVPIPDYAAQLDGSIRDLRIGVPWDYLDALPELESDVASVFRQAVDTLRELGAIVDAVTLPYTDLLDGLYNPILMCEAAAYHQTNLATRGDAYSRGFRQRVLQGFLYTGVEYVQAQRGRSMFAHAFDALMERFDLIAMPTAHCTAPLFETQSSRALNPFTRIFNLTGQPSISVPSGTDQKGLPVGLLLSGRRFEDALVLRAADAYERATPWHTRRPLLTYPATRLAARDTQ
jgi:aspartyl-tRNA(Asn)/glutamyl-tRNA(Gln) amidotransferase subunit A